MTTEINSTIKSNAAATYDALSESFEDLVVKGEDGTIDVKASKRVMLGALSTYLRKAGALKSPGRKPRGAGEVDYTNVHNATYFAFVSNAKGDEPRMPIAALLAATAVEMAAPFESFAAIQREVRKALESHPLLKIESGARKFDGTFVALRGDLVNPMPFRKHGEQPAATPVLAPAPAPEAVPAPVSHSMPDAPNGKPKRNGKPEQRARA